MLTEHSKKHKAYDIANKLVMISYLNMDAFIS